jgi:hypothetical protein
LTREDDKGGTTIPPVIPPALDYKPPDTPTDHFWYFNLESGAKMDMDFVYIQYSFAKNRIPLPLTSSTIIIAAPYVYLDSSLNPTYALGDPRSDYNLADPSKPPPGIVTTDRAYYNVNWLVNDRFLYSFTEDSNHNGRIDRIRAQAAFDVNDDFDDFKAVVEGYTVKGYDRADRVTRTPLLSADQANTMKNIIYIYLEEKDYSDTDARPVWWVAENTTLRDLATNSINIGLPYEERLTTDDNVPPRINYALTVPDAKFNRFGSDTGEIYLQFSEPVHQASLGTAGTVGITALDASSREFIIPLTNPYTVGDLAPSPPTFTLAKIEDNAEYAKDKHSNPAAALYAYQYPSPKYPKDWDYREYVEVRGDPLNNILFVTVPPGGSVPETVPRKDAAAGTINDDTGNKNVGAIPPLSHRVTDALISVPPKDGSDTRYFVWPIWAKYRESANSENLNPGDSFWGQRSVDTGIIWDFGGKKYLEERDTDLQAKLNPSLSGDPVLWFGLGVPDGFRARAFSGGYGHGNPGLWLPSNGTPEFMNLTPGPFSAGSRSQDTGLSTAPNYVYRFKADEQGYDSPAMLDFFFHLPSSPPDLFVTRLAVSPGAPIPLNWYQLVRPFSFEIHDITLQRSGVTILNNVINPNNGESTYVQYHLAKSGPVTIQVFTLDGTMVDILYRGRREAGEYRAVWGGRNRGGRAVARGMYFIRVVGPDIDEIRKVMVVK